MDVNIENFHEVRKFIQEKKLIQRSSYISFDLEFTGVKFENNERQRSETFLNEKYHKMSAVATKYNIIQCGLTFVIQDDNQNIAYPFNFYVFPRQNGNIDPTISMQAGCVKFNTSQGMNWNEWIKKGINYVKISEMYRLLHPQKTRSFKEILESMETQAKQCTTTVLKSIQEFNQKEQDKFIIPKYTAFIVKKAINQYIQEKSLTLSISSEEDDIYEIILIKRITADQVIEKKQRKQEQLVGFTILFEKVWLSKKILVGHNCLYDILFMYAAFVQKLPVDYDNFKNAVSEGRYFYDTKYMASRLQKDKKIFERGTSLQEIQKFFKKQGMDQQIISLAPGFQKYKNPSLHEAGFDSFITMQVFFHLKNAIKDIEELEGKLNINKSFFQMNLRTPQDRISQDMMIFVVPVASYFNFVALDQLRKLKYEQTKRIRQWMKEEVPGFNFGLNEGLKQIFLHSKGRQANEILIKKANQMKSKGVVNSIMSFTSFIKSRKQSNNTKSQ